MRVHHENPIGQSILLPHIHEPGESLKPLDIAMGGPPPFSDGGHFFFDFPPQELSLGEAFLVPFGGLMENALHGRPELMVPLPQGGRGQPLCPGNGGPEGLDLLIEGVNGAGQALSLFQEEARLSCVPVLEAMIQGFSGRQELFQVANFFLQQAYQVGSLDRVLAFHLAYPAG